MHRGHTKGIPLVEEEIAEFGPADAHRVRQNGLEHGLEFARRAGDDLQHLGRCGLLLPARAYATQAAARGRARMPSASLPMPLEIFASGREDPCWPPELRIRRSPSIACQAEGV